MLRLFTIRNKPFCRFPFGIVHFPRWNSTANTSNTTPSADTVADPFASVVGDLQIVPLGVGTSVSKEVIQVEKIIRASVLKYKLHAYGTNVEGPWDKVFEVLKQCHQFLHFERGVVRVSTSVKIGTRIDKKQGMDDKMQKVEDAFKTE